MILGLWSLLHVHAEGKGRFLFGKEAGALLNLKMSRSFPGFRSLQDGKDLVKKFQQKCMKKIMENVSCRVVDW